MNSPLVSLIIPVHYRPGNFSSAVTSALCQTYPQVEVIVSVTRAMFNGYIAEQILAREDQLRYVVEEENRAGELLRLGAASGRGEYIAWLEPDDVLDPRRIEMQMAAALHAGGPCVVTCGVRAHDPTVTRAVDRSPSRLDERAFDGVFATLNSLLAGKVDARTLLVERCWLEAAGGLRGEFQYMYGLDLAIRLAASYPFTHVPAYFVRNILPPSAMGRALGAKERQRIWTRLFYSREEAFSLHGLAELRESAGMDAEFAPPLLANRVASIVGKADLAIFVPPRRSDHHENLALAKDAAGVPRAAAFHSRSFENDPIFLLTEAVELIQSEWMVLLRNSEVPCPEVLTGQLLSVATGLDACLPYSDTLTHDSSSPSSCIAGTVFRTSALRKALRRRVQDEAGFWNVFSKAARIGGLPPCKYRVAPNVEEVGLELRPTPVALVSAFVDPSWYQRVYRDVAEANFEPVAHYLKYGCRENRDPNPWFKAEWYLSSHPEAFHPRRSALDHFLTVGGAKGYRPHPNFDLKWYARKYFGTDETYGEMLLRFLKFGAEAGHVPDPRLDRASVHQTLASTPPSRRADKLQELQGKLLADDKLIAALAGPGAYPDADLWFRPEWYRAQNPEVDCLESALLEQYVTTGAAQGLRPCPEFDPVWYAHHYLQADSPSIEALLHFLSVGLANGAVSDQILHRPDILQELSTFPVSNRSGLMQALFSRAQEEQFLMDKLVDSEWYVFTYPETSIAASGAAEYHRQTGWRSNHNPNAWFDTKWYVAQNSDVLGEDICPLIHFVRSGAREGRWPSRIFDIEWYSRRYLNASVPTAEAFLHFITSGLAMGAAPHPQWESPVSIPESRATGLAAQAASGHTWGIPHVRSELLLSLIDTDWYLVTSQADGETPQDAVEHYLEKGWKEGCDPNAWFDGRWYHLQNPDAAASGVSPLEHFVQTGSSRGSRPHPWFDIAWYMDHHLDAGSNGLEAMRHFLTTGISHGFVPHPLLAEEPILLRLLEIPAPERSDWMKRLLMLLLDPSDTERVVHAADPIYWPALVTRHLPENMTTVLVLREEGFGPGLERLSQSDHEIAATGVIENSGVLRIHPPAHSSGVSVRFALPREGEMLKALLIALRCRRAVLRPMQRDISRIVRAVRNAAVPVFEVS